MRGDASGARCVRRQRRNAARSYGFLQHEHVVADSAAAGVGTACQVPHERADVAVADMHVPADERDLLDADRAGTGRRRRSVNRGFADACAPGVEPRALARVFRRMPLEPGRSAGAGRHGSDCGRCRPGAGGESDDEKGKTNNEKGKTKRESRKTKHEYNYLLTPTLFAGVVKLADARDSKSRGAYTP